MSKNCNDCIKNNRHPNAVGCLECSVFKNNYNNKEQSMKLEYKYGQVFWADLHPGDMIPVGSDNYRILTEEDIDENGYLNIKQEVTNTLNDTIKENK